jgi:hypothetical protein
MCRETARPRRGLEHTPLTFLTPGRARQWPRLRLPACALPAGTPLGRCPPPAPAQARAAAGNKRDYIRDYISVCMTIYIRAFLCYLGMLARIV